MLLYILNTYLTESNVRRSAENEQSRQWLVLIACLVYIGYTAALYGRSIYNLKHIYFILRTDQPFFNFSILFSLLSHSIGRLNLEKKESSETI